MEKFQYRDIRENLVYMYEKRYTDFFLYGDRVCKTFNSDYAIAMLDSEYDLEELVLEGSKLVSSDNVIKPDGIVYNNEYFRGYLMPYFDGISIYDCKECYSPDKLVHIYSKLENIIKNCDNIVFPDLLSDGNILIDDDFNIKLIDFDGMQIGDYSTPILSSDMGNRNVYSDTKYKHGDLYTKQLDIKSLIYLYMKFLLGVNMNSFDCYSGNNQKKELNRFIKAFGIDNDDLVEKIFALYDDDKENVYLGDTVNEIYSNYRTGEVLYDGMHFKKLVRK